MSSYFFFSSRRRHTRYWRDWSSDVCSSDLELDGGGDLVASEFAGAAPSERRLRLPETVRGELRDGWPRPGDGLLGAIEGPVLAANGALHVHLEPMVLGGRAVGFLAGSWNAYVPGPGEDRKSVV